MNRILLICSAVFVIGVSFPSHSEPVFNFKKEQVEVLGVDAYGSVEKMREMVPQTARSLELYDMFISMGATPEKAALFTLKSLAKKIRWQS